MSTDLIVATPAPTIPEFLVLHRDDVDDDSTLVTRHRRLETVVVYDDCTKDDVPRPSYRNMQTFLDACGIGIQYDTFAQSFSLTGVPHHFTLTDAAFEDIRMTMLSTGLKVDEKVLWQFLRSKGRERKHNPLLEYLESLVWDGVPRLDALLIRHFGAEDNAYTRAVTRCDAIGMVRRLRQPGCKFDNVLTLDGDEGLGKSTFFRIMAYDVYFTDNLPIASDGKKTIEQMRGKWRAELGELVGADKKEEQEIKAFITRQVDESRLVWDKETSKVPRQFGLGATTNKTRPLKGSDGNRRFWIVHCTKKMDPDALIAERDQIWAEAMVAEKAGEPQWLPDELEQQARVIQQDSTRVHPLQEKLEALLEDWKSQSCFVPTEDLYEAVGITPQHIGRLSYQHNDIVEGAMRRLGFQPCRGTKRKHCGNTRVSGFESPSGWNSVVLMFNGHGFDEVDKDAYATRRKDRVLN